MNSVTGLLKQMPPALLLDAPLLQAPPLLMGPHWLALTHVRTGGGFDV